MSYDLRPVHDFQVQVAPLFSKILEDSMTILNKLYHNHRSMFTIIRYKALSLTVLLVK